MMKYTEKQTNEKKKKKLEKKTVLIISNFTTIQYYHPISGDLEPKAKSNLGCHINIVICMAYISVFVSSWYSRNWRSYGHMVTLWPWLLTPDHEKSYFLKSCLVMFYALAYCVARTFVAMYYVRYIIRFKSDPLAAFVHIPSAENVKIRKRVRFQSD